MRTWRITRDDDGVDASGAERIPDGCKQRYDMIWSLLQSLAAGEKNRATRTRNLGDLESGCRFQGEKGLVEV